MKLNARSRRGLGVLAGLALVLPLAAGQGCPGGAGFPLPSGLLVSVISPRFDQTVSDGGLVTIVYDVTTTVSGRMEVSAFYDADGVAGTGDERYFAHNLASGTNKFIQLSTANMPAGAWYVGITASDASGAQDTAYGAGRIIILGTAAMSFTSPSRDMTLGVGVLLPVRFDAGSEVRNFTWRLFYDTDGALNGNEITIAEGTNNNSSRVTRDWDTGNLAPDITYYIGATVILADGTAKTAYAGGAVTITSGAYLEFLTPTGSQVIEAGTPVPLVVAAGDPSAATPQVRFFYDNDSSFQNGYIAIIDLVPAATGATVWYPPAELPSGRYYIGAELVGGSSTLVGYAAGTVQIVGQGEYSEGDEESGSGKTAHGTLLLTMRTPFRDQILFSGEQFTIRWTTNLKLGEGTITLFREPDVDNDGEPDGEETRVQIGPTGLDASTKSYVFDTSRVVGKFYIGATIKPVGAQAETDYASGALTIIPSMFWVGDLRTLKPKEKPSVQRMYMKGALFQGHNLRDNLGSAMLLVDDYDGGEIPCCNIGPFDEETHCCTICGLPECGTDAVCPGVVEIGGCREILLAAQYGKPWFAAQGGRGAGEAYMIYGTAGQRYLGTYDVNSVGSSKLPGVLFTGIIPNPNPANTPRGMAGNSIPYTPQGETALPYSTEGLCSVTLIPDQDGDGKKEIVFGFPYCNSYSLRYQVLDGSHPAPLLALGRLEENGHFLRGGLVIVSSTNSLLTTPTALSRHFDRVLQLHEVGQVFQTMYTGIGAGSPRTHFDVPATHDFLPKCCKAPEDSDPYPADDAVDIAFFPGEGFMQNTQTETLQPLFTFPSSGAYEGTSGIDPPRLATPPQVSTPGYPDSALIIAYGDYVSLSQVDPPPGPLSTDFVGGRDLPWCVWTRTNAEGVPLPPFGTWPYQLAGMMRVLGTGHYYAPASLPVLGEPACDPGILSPYEGGAGGYCPAGRISPPREPYGCRILGQTTTQLYTTPATKANRFGASVSVSGDFLLIGAPDRTVRKNDVTALRNDPMLGDRANSGEIYMLQLRRPGVPAYKNMWNSQNGVGTDEQGNVTVSYISTAPAPHNYIIQDLGYTRCECCPKANYWKPGDVAFEMTRPFHIVGMNNDHIGEVTGLPDLNNDGVTDMAVGGAGTNGSKGAVYVIYRRQPEVEADYLLERIQLAPSDPNRLVGLMIIGREGEQLGTAIAGVGPRPQTLNDDYNDDGYPDMIIGSPYASPGSGYQAGEVFILFGGRTLLSPGQGITIPQLRDAGEGMVLAGVTARDHAGQTVAAAGDINHDGVADLLIAAPDASPRFDSDGDGILDAIGLDLNGDRRADDLDGDGTPDDMTGAGLVYVVFGGKHLRGTIGLDQIGTPNLPGLVFVGRKGGDHLGGGKSDNSPNAPAARGINTAGDLDSDGRDDILLSSILADPDGKMDAGEVYLIYGFETPIKPANQKK